MQVASVPLTTFWYSIRFLFIWSFTRWHFVYAQFDMQKYLAKNFITIQMSQLTIWCCLISDHWLCHLDILYTLADDRTSRFGLAWLTIACDFFSGWTSEAINSAEMTPNLMCISIGDIMICQDIFLSQMDRFDGRERCQIFSAELLWLLIDALQINSFPSYIH